MPQSARKSRMCKLDFCLIVLHLCTHAVLHQIIGWYGETSVLAFPCKGGGNVAYAAHP